MLEAKDPYLLLSIVNTKLRDEAESFKELCKAYGKNEDEIMMKLKIIGYSYDAAHNQFVAE